MPPAACVEAFGVVGEGDLVAAFLGSHHLQRFRLVIVAAGGAFQSAAFTAELERAAAAGGNYSWQYSWFVLLSFKIIPPGPHTLGCTDRRTDCAAAPRCDRPHSRPPAAPARSAAAPARA